ncbi:MAG: hypothetical protein ACPG31_08805 [Planctomycetota bacterium]
MRLFLILTILALIGADARAQGVKALVLGAESSDPWVMEVRDTLFATGLFDTVDWMNSAQTIPSASTLADYDAVLVWSDSGITNSTQLGNDLADFVDEGGGVVVAVWGVTNFSSNHFLQGRWLTGGYQVFMNDSGYITGSSSLGTVHDANHPVMENVTTFQGGTSSYRCIGTNLSPGSYRVADWADGNVLVAANDSGSAPRVDVNFFPPSSINRGDFWQSSTDGDLLLAQALIYTSGGGQPKLEIVEAVPGAYLTFDIKHCKDNADVVTILSSRGAGPTTTPYGIIEVTAPWFRTPPFRANEEGLLNFSITLPIGAAGHTLYAQSVELSIDGIEEPRLSTPVVLPLP